MPIAAVFLLLPAGFAPRGPFVPFPAVTRAAASVRLCAPPDVPKLREYNAEEEKALRAIRLEFGGYPPGKYFTIQQEQSDAAAYEQVKKDQPTLASWTDAEISDVLDEMVSTPAELLIYSPIGPFLILSAISIWRDGLSAWGIPPCKDYVGVCKDFFG